MSFEDENWVRQPEDPNANQDYVFNGKGFVTQGVKRELSEGEIKQIVDEIYTAVLMEDKIDYMQVFKKGDKIVWIIDQLSVSQLKDNDYTEKQKEEYNYFTVLLPSEY